MSIIFSEDFASDPDWRRQSLNESSQNSFDHVPGGTREGYLRASVDDVSPIWYDLQTSPTFGPVSLESDFEITFAFNLIQAARAIAVDFGAVSGRNTAPFLVEFFVQNGH